jgi:WD40 repeat protein
MIALKDILFTLGVFLGSFIAGCVVFIVGCRVTHPASPAASKPQAQADNANGPFERVGAPIAIAGDYNIGLSGNGRMMIAVEPLGTNRNMHVARVWDLDAVKPVTGPLPLGSLDYGLSFDASVAFTTDREHIYVWDVITSRLIWTKEIHQSESQLDGAAIKPDGTEIMAVSEADKSVKVWRVGSDHPRLSISQTDVAISIDFDPTGKRIVTLCDGLRQFYDAQTGRELFPGVVYFPDRLSDLTHHFDSTGRRFLELQDQGARLIDTANGKPLLRIQTNDNVSLARWSVDSDKIALSMPHGKAQIYDAATGKFERTIVGDEDLFNCYILPGSRWAICERSGRRPLEVWDLTTGQMVQTLSGSWYCRAAPVSSTLITTDAGSVVKIWRLRADFR